MKRNIRKKLKDTKGITLVALVVTIIVLLILAGVALSSVLSQDGIFHRAEQATDKYGQEKARETLELTLGEAQMQKYEQGLTDEQLDNKINEIGELLPKEKPDPNLQNVIVDGHIFEIDRSVPKIADYIGPANGVVITAVVSGNGGWFKVGEIANVIVTGRIKTYSGGTIMSVSATKGGTPITGFSIDGEGKYTIDNITVDTTIVITAKDSNNKESARTIPITIRIDDVKPILSEVTATVEARRIKIKATATDNESGLKQINYSVEPTTIEDGKATGTLSTGQEITLTATTSEEYTITLTAEDNVGNKSEAQTKKVETVGVIKHIKLNDGSLKEVNTVDIYGATVTGYSCPRDSVTDAKINKPEWQIFYIDEEDDHRVYLISKDYMVPPTTNTELTKSGSSKYPKAYNFNNTVLNKYTATIPDMPFTTKFLSEYKGVNVSQNNLQATNYILDQMIWKEYINRDKADYAFGGPTLPLFKVSYNDISKKATKLDYQKSGTGYQINQGGGSWETLKTGYGSTNTQKEIYFKGSDSDSACGMWIGSPNCDDGECLVTARFGSDGTVGRDSAASGVNDIGFRPIVSLQTKVTFTENANGTYTIN